MMGRYSKQKGQTNSDLREQKESFDITEPGVAMGMWKRMRLKG